MRFEVTETTPTAPEVMKGKVRESSPVKMVKSSGRVAGSTSGVYSSFPFWPGETEASLSAARTWRGTPRVTINVAVSNVALVRFIVLFTRLSFLRLASLRRGVI